MWYVPALSHHRLSNIIVESFPHLKVFKIKVRIINLHIGHCLTKNIQKILTILGIIVAETLN